MDLNTRVKLLIGEQALAVLQLQTQVEDLQKKIEAQESKDQLLNSERKENAD